MQIKKLNDLGLVKKRMGFSLDTQLHGISLCEDDDVHLYWNKY